MGSGRRPSRQTISCILESKIAALVAAVFFDFPMNRCNFLHKKNKIEFTVKQRKQIAAMGQIPHRAAPYEDGAVGAYDDNARYGCQLSGFDPKSWGFGLKSPGSRFNAEISA